MMSAAQLFEEPQAPVQAPAPAPSLPHMEWVDEGVEDDPYEMYVLRRPHERSSTVLQHLVKQPEYADTRLRYHRIGDEAAMSAIPRRFEFPTRPSMLESLTDTDDESEMGSRRGRSTFSRRSFSLPSSAGNVTSVKQDHRRHQQQQQQQPKKRVLVPPGLPKSPPPSTQPLFETKRRDSLPIQTFPSMFGYPPNARPPEKYNRSMHMKENRNSSSGQRCNIEGKRKVTAPAAYGTNAAKNFSLVVESPTTRTRRIPRIPRPTPKVHAPPTQWPPLPSEWPPTAPILAGGVSSSGNVPLRVEAIGGERNCNGKNSSRKIQRQNLDKETKSKNRGKRRSVMRTSARLRTYLRTARGRERAATGAATKRSMNHHAHPSNSDGVGIGVGIERDREMSIVSANGKDDKISGRAALRRVLNLLRLTAVQRAK